jgi:hypothetical protein
MKMSHYFGKGAGVSRKVQKNRIKLQLPAPVLDHGRRKDEFANVCI